MSNHIILNALILILIFQCNNSSSQRISEIEDGIKNSLNKFNFTSSVSINHAGDTVNIVLYLNNLNNLKDKESSFELFKYILIDNYHYIRGNFINIKNDINKKGAGYGMWIDSTNLQELYINRPNEEYYDLLKYSFNNLTLGTYVMSNIIISDLKKYHTAMNFPDSFGKLLREYTDKCHETNIVKNNKFIIFSKISIEEEGGISKEHMKYYFKKCSYNPKVLDIPVSDSLFWKKLLIPQ